MPQPINHARRPSFAYGNAFLSRPDFAIRFAHIANVWNLIENDLLRLFSLCLDAKLEIAAGLFRESYNIAPRLRLLKVVAKATLPAELADELGKKVKQIEKIHKRRSTIIHGVWAVPVETRPPWLHKDKLESCLVLIDPPGNGLPQEMHLYTLADFEDILQSMVALKEWIQNFTETVIALIRERKQGRQAQAV
jgi:hypothetical protein